MGLVLQSDDHIDLIDCLVEFYQAHVDLSILSSILRGHRSNNQGKRHAESVQGVKERKGTTDSSLTLFFFCF